MGSSINLNKSYRNGNRNVLMAVLFYFILYYFFILYFIFFICFFYLFIWHWSNISVHYWKLCKTNAKQKKSFCKYDKWPLFTTVYRWNQGAPLWRSSTFRLYLRKLESISRSLKVQHVCWTLPFKIARQMFRSFCELLRLYWRSCIKLIWMTNTTYDNENLLWCPRMGKDD